jgi:hypothetical protein
MPSACPLLVSYRALAAARSFIVGLICAAIALPFTLIVEEMFAARAPPLLVARKERR